MHHSTRTTTGRSPGLCSRSARGAAAAAALLVGLTGLPALAATTPVELPQGITMFPERDFVGVEGFPLEELTVNVWRGDVKIGSAVGTPSPAGDTGTLLEVNHPGGICWTGTTPDLLAGDRVEVLTSEVDHDGTPVGQDARVQDVTASPAQAADLDDDGVDDDLVVHGTARDLVTGGRLDESRVEQRVVNPDFLSTDVGRRDVRALFAASPVGGTGGTSVIRWDDQTPGSTDPHFTATYEDLGVEAVDVAVAGQTRVLAWERTSVAGDRIGMSIFEAGEVGGPGFGGCPAAAVDAVTSTAPAAVNIAAMASGGDLVVHGVAHDAADVELRVDDADADPTDVVTASAVLSRPASDNPTVPLPGAQTWTATVPMADLAGLADGELTLTGTFRRMTERVVQVDADGDPETPPVPQVVREAHPIGGARHVLLKDLVAPLPPTADPLGGEYFGTQAVSVAAADEAAEVVRYRLGPEPGPAPTSASPLVTGQLLVTSSQTLKAVSFDRAGNPSPLLGATYVIRTAGVPDAPAAPTGVAGDGQVRLSWSAPVANGSPVTAYVLRAYTADSPDVPVSEVVVGPQLSGVVPDLLNGVDHTFTVSAVNGVGESAPSPESAAVRPVAPARSPFAPTIGTATASPGSATVTWSAPSSDGGAPITGHRVTVFNGATGAQIGAVRLAGADATSLLVTGLANGQPYDFEVRAVNRLGVGEVSERSNTVVPATAPNAPGAVTATAGTASATVRWTAPTSDGGAPVESYAVEVSTAAGVVQTVTGLPADATSATITKLTNGTAHVFRVRAVNAAGQSAASAASASVVPASVPTAPTAVAARRGNASAVLTWTAPSNAATSAVTGYRVRRYAGSTTTLQSTTVVAATARSLTATGLVNGSSYSFDVTAVGTLATGAVSARSAVVVPATTPTAPTIGAAVAGVRGGAVTATAAWTAPTSTGGSAVTGYRVTAQRFSSTGAVLSTTTSAVLPATARSHAMALPAVGTYRFRVVALNAVGTSPASAASNAVTGR